MKTLFRHTALTSLMGIVQAMSGMALSILVARLLEPAGRGAYSLAFLIIGTAGFVANPCIYASANYFLSSHRQTIEQILLPTLVLSLVSSSIGFTSAIVGGFWLVNAVNVFGWTNLLVVGVGAAAYSASISLNGILYGARQVRIITLWTMILAVLQCALVSLVIFIAPPSVNLFVSLYVGSLLIDVLMKTLFSFQALTSRPQFSMQPIVEMLRYGGTVYTGRILTLLSQRLDTYILYAFAGQVVLGYYSIATSLGEQLWILPSSVSLVMMTNIAHRDQRSAADMTVATSRMVFAIPLLAATILGIIGPWLIPLLYGQAYQPSVIPFLLILPGIVAISSYSVIEPFFQSRGKPLLPVYISATGMLVNLLICLALIPHFGMYGAAIAYSISYIVQLGVAGMLFAHLTNTSPWSLVNIRLAVADALSLVQAQLAKRTNRTTVS